jgi:predicted nuclease of predicted toxin-antitoxin system
MKFLVDAQLPKRLARFLQSAGYDAIHTSDLPQRNATRDSDLNTLSIQEQRILISKDADFVESFLLQKQPYKLLLISTGNINNNELENLFQKNLEQITVLLETHNYIEISRDTIIIHQ